MNMYSIICLSFLGLSILYSLGMLVYVIIRNITLKKRVKKELDEVKNDD